MRPSSEDNPACSDGDPRLPDIPERLRTRQGVTISRSRYLGVYCTLMLLALVPLRLPFTVLGCAIGYTAFFASCVWFAVGGVWLAARMYERCATSVTLEPEGLRFSTLRLPRELISWDEIEAVDITPRGVLLTTFGGPREIPRTIPAWREFGGWFEECFGQPASDETPGSDLSAIAVSHLAKQPAGQLTVGLRPHPWGIAAVFIAQHVAFWVDMMFITKVDTGAAAYIHTAAIVLIVVLMARSYSHAWRHRRLTLRAEGCELTGSSGPLRVAWSDVLSVRARRRGWTVTCRQAEFVLPTGGGGPAAARLFQSVLAAKADAHRSAPAPGE